MGVYQCLKEVLGHEKSGYSPNNVRAIFIGVEFIAVVPHVGPVRRVLLKYEEVCNDIQKNGSTGCLNNLLTKHQMSCLEEIYVDGTYQQCKGLINLESYIQTLLKDSTRIRCYGYCSGVSYEEIKSKYCSGVSDYLYGMDNNRAGRISGTPVNNPMWYTKHMLRPNDYELDSPKRELSIKLNKIEAQMSAAVAEKRKAEEVKTVSQALAEVMRRDITILSSKSYALYRGLVASITRNNVKNEICGRMHKEISKGLELRKSNLLSICSNGKGVERFSPTVSIVTFSQVVNTALKSTGLGLDACKKLKVDLHNCYRELALISQEKDELNLEFLTRVLSSEQGLSGYNTMMLNMCKEIAKDRGGLDTVHIASILVLPNSLRVKYDNDTDKIFDELYESDKASFFEYGVSFLMKLSGYTEEDLKKELKAYNSQFNSQGGK